MLPPHSSDSIVDEFTPDRWMCPHGSERIVGHRETNWRIRTEVGIAAVMEGDTSAAWAVLWAFMGSNLPQPELAPASESWPLASRSLGANVRGAHVGCGPQDHPPPAFIASESVGDIVGLTPAATDVVSSPGFARPKSSRLTTATAVGHPAISPGSICLMIRPYRPPSIDPDAS